MEENKITKWLKKNIILTVVAAVVIMTVIAVPIGVNAYNRNQYNKFISLGDKALEGEKFDDAVKYYKEALAYTKKQSSDIDGKLASVESAKEGKADFEQGIKLLDDKKYLEAIEVFKKVNSSNKYFKNSQDKITEAGSDYIDENLTNAKAEAGNKKYNEAIAYLDNIIKFDSSNQDAISLKEQYNKELANIAVQADAAKKKAEEDKASAAQIASAGNTANVSSTSSTTYGNTSGNIINYGISCFDGEFIYFPNKSDGNKIYKARPNGSGLSKVSETAGEEINVVGDWVYYSRGMFNAGIYKVKKNGSGTTKICDDRIACINVVGDWIYYSADKDGTFNIYKIKVDGTGKAKIPFEGGNYAMVDDPDFAVSGGWIYANVHSISDKSTVLCRIKTDGSVVNKLMNTAAHHFTINKDWIYYISNNNELAKMKTDGSSKSTVYRVNSFVIYSINVSDNSIYFSADNQSADKEYGGIYRLNMDGSGVTRISKTWCKHFCISSNWIYFDGQPDSGSTTMRVRTDGTQESTTW